MGRFPVGTASTWAECVPVRSGVVAGLEWGAEEAEAFRSPAVRPGTGYDAPPGKDSCAIARSAGNAWRSSMGHRQSAYPSDGELRQTSKCRF